jgi:RNA polymerase sigma factor (sigma-70 family)
VAAVPSIGRATRVEGRAAPEADATRSLYERYGSQIFGYCLHQLGSREEAEDAVQSTFLNAFRGLSRGIVPEAESAWLFAIANNVCLSRRRSSWRRGRIESSADFEVVEELAPARSTRADELIGLQDVLAQMPENQRRAILLREWQGMSYREIADELELSQGAVETLIFRARRSLAQGLEASPAEQRSWRSRARASLDVGSVLGAIKSLLASGAAVKMAGAAAVVAVSSVAATTSPSQPHRSHLLPKSQVAPVAPTPIRVRTQGLVAPAVGGRRVQAPAHIAKKIVGASILAGPTLPVEASTPPAAPAVDTPQAPPADQAPPAQQDSSAPQAPAQAPQTHDSPAPAHPGQKSDGAGKPSGTAAGDKSKADQPGATSGRSGQTSGDQSSAGQGSGDKQAQPSTGQGKQGSTDSGKQGSTDNGKQRSSDASGRSQAASLSAGDQASSGDHTDVPVVATAPQPAAPVVATVQQPAAPAQQSAGGRQQSGQGNGNGDGNSRGKSGNNK